MLTPRLPISVGNCAIQPCIAPLSSAAATGGFRLKPKPTNLMEPARFVSCNTFSIAMEPGVLEARIAVVPGCKVSNCRAFSSS